MSEWALAATDLSFHYGTREALSGFNLRVPTGKFTGLLGPNGGGKSTAFRVFATLARPQSGRVEIFGRDAIQHLQASRAAIGVVFQSPALDKKLSVEENLRYHGALYGLGGNKLKTRIEHLLKRFELSDRAEDRVEILSGGLKRRVEIAKALLNSPKLLILDEPTTGLDPGARRAVWNYLKSLRVEEGLTVLTTTHLLDEAEACDQICFLDGGRTVLEGTPQELKARVGGEVITIRAAQPEALRAKIAEAFDLAPRVVDSDVCITRENAASFIPQLAARFATEMSALTLSQPSLEDVFIQATGRRLSTEGVLS